MEVIKGTGEADFEEIGEVIGEAEEVVVDVVDTSPLHTLGSQDTINKDINPDTLEYSRYSKDMDHMDRRSSSNSNNNSSKPLINNMRLSRCRETTNREGCGRPYPGMEEGIQLDNDHDVLRNDDQAGEKTDHGAGNKWH